jgi:putative phosphonate catabolism associated alcohol dehydrogenase
MSRAAVFFRVGQPLEISELALPESLAAGEMLVRVTCCTLCGSDLSTLDGHRQEPTPCILGHEIVGAIESLGPDEVCDLRGRAASVGDRVVWSVSASCDNCRNCQRGLPQKCRSLRKYGHHRLADDWQLSGGLAEHCHLIRGTKFVIIDEQLPDEVACLASCAIATVAAAIRTAGELDGARVLVIGAGLLGLTASAMASELGAESVVVCDTQLPRLELAKRFAADQTLTPTELQSALETSKFDIVLEMSGSNMAVQNAIAAADVGASVILVGSVRPIPPIELFPERVVRQVLSLHGVHNYRPEDLLTAVDFLQGSGRHFPFAEGVSQHYSLADINQAVNSPSRGDAIRIAIKP